MIRVSADGEPIEAAAFVPAAAVWLLYPIKPITNSYKYITDFRELEQNRQPITSNTL